MTAWSLPPFTDDDRTAFKVHVFHPKLQTLVDPHPRAIQQLSEQAMFAIEEAKKLDNLVRRQDDREAPFGPRPANLLHPRQIHPKHLAVEEQQSRQRLLVRRCRHVPRVGEPEKEFLNFIRPQYRRVAAVMKSNKGAHPIDINLLSPYAVVQIADALAKLVEHLCRFQRG